MMATLGDLADAINSDNAAIKSDQDSLVKLQSDLATAQTNLSNDQSKLTSDTAVLTSKLATTGGFFRLNPDGTATVYELDTDGHLEITILKPDTTPVP